MAQGSRWILDRIEDWSTPSDEMFKLRQFSSTEQQRDLRTYHDLMNAIFPVQSVYCPVISMAEREYNYAKVSPMFDADYSWFLESEGQAVGFVVAYGDDDRLVLKTIGVLPERRLGRAFPRLLQAIHHRAENNGIKQIIYGIVRQGNAVDKMRPAEVPVVRRYVTMVRSS